MDHAVYVFNRSAHRKFNWTPPASQVGLGQLSLDYNRVFGCLVFYRSLNPRKLDPRALPGVFVGIDVRGSHATYKIYDFNTKSVKVRFIQDVYFVEDSTWSSYVEKNRGEYDLPKDAALYFDSQSVREQQQPADTDDAST